MYNSFGHLFRITTFGESHGPAIGVILDGVPSGLEIFKEDIQKELDRRRPGQSVLTTKRQESDEVEILSGVFENTTTGAPIALLIRNKDQDSSKYDDLKNVYRPGHADFTYDAKYHLRDHRGGGRSSGRETACRVAAGAIAKKFLEAAGVSITAAVTQIADVKASKWDPKFIEKNPVRTADASVAKAMEERIVAARNEGDSVGGVVECRIAPVPVGLGEPLYAKLDAMLASAMFSIGAVRALEFGNGFACAELRGSENNDAMNEQGFSSNRCGGILGGLSNGEPLIFRMAIKPTASIAKEQLSINKEGEPTPLCVHGRHDPCICPRAVPVIEAMAALTLMDAYLMSGVQDFIS